MSLFEAMERWHRAMVEFGRGRGPGVLQAAKEGMRVARRVCDEGNLSPGERTMLMRSAAGGPLLQAGDRVIVLDVDDEAPIELVGLTLEVEGIDPAAEEYVILLWRPVARNALNSSFWVDPGPEGVERVRLLMSNVELESCARTTPPEET